MTSQGHGALPRRPMVIVCAALFAGLLVVAGAKEEQRSREIRHTQSGVSFNSVALAVRNYAADHDGYLPPMNDVAAFRASLRPYLYDDAAFRNWYEPSILYLPNPNLAHRKLRDLPEKTLLLYESAPGAGNYRWVIFFPPTSVTSSIAAPDFAGMVRVDAEQWERLRKIQRPSPL